MRGNRRTMGYVIKSLSLLVVTKAQQGWLSVSRVPDIGLESFSLKPATQKETPHPRD